MNAKILSAVALAVATLTACQGGKKENTPTSTPAAASSAVKMAYVNLDSVQEHYQYFLEEKAAAESLVNSYQSAVQQKESALQQMQTDIQQRMQNGKITSEEQYKSEVAKFQRQQEAYSRYRTEMEQKIAGEQQRVNEALQDSLDHFLAEYNKSKKYAFILNKAVLLYADQAMDITDEVIAGLNKRYKKNK